MYSQRDFIKAYIRSCYSNILQRCPNHTSKSQPAPLLGRSASTSHFTSYNFLWALSAPATLGFSLNTLSKLCLRSSAPDFLCLKCLPHYLHGLFPQLPPTGLDSNATISWGPLYSHSNENHTHPTCSISFSVIFSQHLPPPNIVYMLLILLIEGLSPPTRI